MRYDLDKLRVDDYFIFQIVSRASRQTSGTHYVDVDKIIRIAPATRSRLIAAAVAPPAPTQKENQMSVEIPAINPAVIQMYATWKSPVGMADIVRNGELLADTIANSFGNVYSHANLDAAVVKLGDKLSWERGYSPSEATAVWSEFWAKYAPKNIQRSASNQSTLKAYLDKYFHGLVTISNLNLSLSNLSLALVPEPPKPRELTPAEKTAIQEANQLKRIQKDKLENSEEAFFERAKAAEARLNDEKEAKRQTNAKDALLSEIMSYEAYRGPNSRDWSAIELVIGDLKRIAVRVNGKLDFVRTLALVKEVKLKLPDRPLMGDVDKIVRRIAEQQQRERESPVDKKTLEANSWANRPR